MSDLRLSRTALRCITTALGALTALSCGATLPDPVASGQMVFNLGASRTIDIFGTFNLPDARLGVLSITLDGQDTPLVQATADVGNNPLLPLMSGRSTADIRYLFQITGPQRSVDIVAEAAGFVQGAAGSGATFALRAGWQLVDSFTSQVLAANQVKTPQMGGAFSGGFSDVVPLTLRIGVPYLVELTADVSGAATDAGSHVKGVAWADPHFRFADGVDPAEYSFEFSNGIGNGPIAGVPEPDGQALMAAGLAMLLALRRQRTALSFIKPSTAAAS